MVTVARFQNKRMVVTGKRRREGRAHSGAFDPRSRANATEQRPRLATCIKLSLDSFSVVHPALSDVHRSARPRRPRRDAKADSSACSADRSADAVQQMCDLICLCWSERQREPRAHPNRSPGPLTVLPRLVAPRTPSSEQEELHRIATDLAAQSSPGPPRAACPSPSPRAQSR